MYLELARTTGFSWGRGRTKISRTRRSSISIKEQCNSMNTSKEKR
jgi:hypothetical protein